MTSEVVRTKPKQMNRKCSYQNCDNGAVQGGVCITHGARRKCCAHPGCDKAVKLSRYCSAHGPSRQKCDHEGGCTQIVIQGGWCISHGARKRVCCYPGGLSDGKNRGGQVPCNKNAIVGVMCKKHHDRMVEARGTLDAMAMGQVVAAWGASGRQAPKRCGQRCITARGETIASVIVKQVKQV